VCLYDCCLVSLPVPVTVLCVCPSVLTEAPSASPVDSRCVESRLKADDLMLVSSMKEATGDLHAALLCCNQAACTSLSLSVFTRATLC